MTHVLGYRRDGRPIYPIAGAAPYEFPFDVPEDLSTLSDAELSDLADHAREHARELLDNENAERNALAETRTLVESIQAEQNARVQSNDDRAALSSVLENSGTGSNDNDDSDTDDGDGGDEPGAVTASRGGGRAPSVRDVAGGGSTLETPPEPDAERHVSMRAASDVPGFPSGVELESFAQAAEAIDNRLAAYSAPSGRKGGKPMKLGKNRFGMRSPSRHGAVQFRRDFPDELTITEGSNPLKVLDHAANERRLPGGSLVQSAQKLVESGKALTAAVGWCAPSEVIYDLCELESLDGILDLPEVQAARGGFQIPLDGGPDFATIFESIGDEGDVTLSEYDVENDATKVCLEVPCPDFDDVRLDVAYFCLTGSLLQRRGYPEVVARFSRGGMVALAHKINASVISKIETASTDAGTIPTIDGSDDAASALLSAVELAITDTKYHNRMPFAASLEIVLPMWVLAVIRAALARRKGVARLNVTDQEIMGWFANRNAVPRFVYDWQDAFTGLAGGPGDSTPITSLPDDVQFLVYPAGTWTKAVRDVVSLDTVYDSTLLSQNQYTAVFVEDGFNVLQTCPDSRLYQVAVDPAGIVGCCTETS